MVAIPTIILHIISSMHKLIHIQDYIAITHHNYYNDTVNITSLSTKSHISSPYQLYQIPPIIINISVHHQIIISSAQNIIYYTSPSTNHNPYYHLNRKHTFQIHVTYPQAIITNHISHSIFTSMQPGLLDKLVVTCFSRSYYYNKKNRNKQNKKVWKISSESKN